MISFKQPGGLYRANDITFVENGELYRVKSIFYRKGTNVYHVYGEPNAIQPVYEGLMLWWDVRANYKQDYDTEAPYWEDISGNQNHGYLFGLNTSMSWTSSGLFCNADGTYCNYAQTDYERKDILMDIPDTVTFEAVLKGYRHLINSSWNPMIHDWGLNGLAGYWFGFAGTDASPKIRFFFGSTYDLMIEQSISIDQFQNTKTFTVTYNAATKRVIIYFDGVQFYNSTSSRNNFGAHKSKIKIMNSSPPNEQLAGTMSAARVYNRVLTPQEVLNNHQANVQAYFT